MNRVYEGFETKENYYVYDRNKDKIIKVLQDEYELLTSIDNDNEFEENSRKFKKYTKQGFLCQSTLKRIKNPYEDTIEDRVSNKAGQMVLQLTQCCNLRCSYCFYGEGNYDNRSHSNKKMSFEMAKKGIDYLFEHSKDLHKIRFSFYGGEPLLEMDLIKKCVDYIEHKKEGKLIKYNLTTNGTLFCDDNIKYFIKNDFELTISLDGTREQHNLNRKFANGEGSFDKVIENVRYIKQEYPELFDNLTFNTVISTKSDFNCIKNFYDDDSIMKDAMVITNMLTEAYSTSKHYYDEGYILSHKYGKFKALLMALGKLDKKYVSRLFYPIIRELRFTYSKFSESNFLPEEFHPGGPCIAGTTRIFLNADGNFYTCERVSEKSKNAIIGNVHNGMNIDKIKKIINLGKVTEKECLECWAFRYCTTCLALMDDTEELSRELRLKKCSGIKNALLEEFKDICMLKEFGFDFEGEYI
ncbi:Cys-rich peptide radical SAM maturase CcpM [uncultured Clostridium sp.]|uniref:Cys-rich peptide radical SAM maturase CcpM n=1 Tax=uncultured Clostridium sp. TaxID=59620 RepID=UPI0028EE163E|nr:Cys-rich peptide radical SAM maturase CcpM [uncultured Clostridium sp.]